MSTTKSKCQQQMSASNTVMRRHRFANASASNSNRKQCTNSNMGNKIISQLKSATTLINSSESKRIGEHNDDDDYREERRPQFVEYDDDNDDDFVLLGASIDSATARLALTDHRRQRIADNVRRSMDDGNVDSTTSERRRVMTMEGQKEKTAMDRMTMALKDAALTKKKTTSGDAERRTTERDHERKNATVLRNRSSSSTSASMQQLSHHHTSQRHHRSSPIAPSKCRKGNAALSAASQTVVKYCFENAHDDIGSRIFVRMAHKRDDFAAFCSTLNAEQFKDMCVELRQYIASVVSCVDSAEQVRSLSTNYGIQQVSKRSSGFKADFFAAMADALTTECVFLDMATHQPTEVIEAWAELVELMFSSIRDGFYQQIRNLRRRSYCFNSPSRNTSSDLSSTDGSIDNNSTSSHVVSATGNSHQSIIDDENRLSATSSSGYYSSSPAVSIGSASLCIGGSITPSRV